MKNITILFAFLFFSVGAFGQCSIFLTHTNDSCPGKCSGTATAYGGGFGPPTYLWMPGGMTTQSISGLCAGSYTCTLTSSTGTMTCAAVDSVTITEPAALTLTVSSNPGTSCTPCNGSANVSVSGGTQPYQYSWSPSGGGSANPSFLCAGNYTVTVTDWYKCTATATVNVAGTGPSTTITSANASCHGACDGTAAANVTGGTAPYTYSWSPSGGNSSAATGLCAGSYTVQIRDAGGCSSVLTVNISEPAALTLKDTVTNGTCGGTCDGSITVTPSGGASPYTYAWSPSGGSSVAATGLCTGNYTVLVTDSSGCTVSGTYTVTLPTAPTASVSSTNSTGCAPCNGSASASITGGIAPYTYAWSPGGGTSSAVSGLCAGSYTLVVSDSNKCSTTSTVSITGATVPTATLSSTNGTCFAACDGSANASVTGGTAPFTYTWSPSGGSSSAATGLCAGSYTIQISDAGGCSTTSTVTITEPAVLTAKDTMTQGKCGGSCDGSITVMPSGGTSPYTYAWSPSGGSSAAATGLCSGNYTVLVTDSSGCTLARSYTVTLPTVITASVSSANSTGCMPCDGSASAAVTGGTAPYTYSWSPGGGTSSAVSGLCAGSYTVMVIDSNSCSLTSTVSITGVSGPAAAVSGINATCFNACDGNATANVTGGTAPYTYAWSPAGGSSSAATGLCAGNYTVQVTDGNGCFSFSTVSIGEPAALTATVSSSSGACAGSCSGSATVGVSGGTMPYTFTWSPAGGSAATATGLCPANYTVIVADSSGCADTITVNIAPVSGPTVAITTSADSATANATGNSPFSYQWSNGQTTQTATGLTNGTYTVCVTDANGCVTCDTTNIMLTALAQLNADPLIRIYPNPAVGYLFIEAAFDRAQAVKISIDNMIGETVLIEESYSSGSVNRRFSVENMQPGIYFIRVATARETITRKISIAR